MSEAMVGRSYARLVVTAGSYPPVTGGVWGDRAALQIITLRPPRDAPVDSRPTRHG